MMNTLEEDDDNLFRSVAAWLPEQAGITALGNWIIYRSPEGNISVVYKRKQIGEGSQAGDGHIDWAKGVDKGVIHYAGRAVRGEIEGLRPEDGIIYV